MKKSKSKYSNIMAKMLNVMEFRLDKIDDKYCLIDLQGGNLGNIESERFSSAEGIIEELSTYLEDYYFTDLEEAAESDLEMDFSQNEAPYTAEEWVKFMNKYKEFKEMYKHEYDVMDMIAYNIDKVNLFDVFVIQSLHKLEYDAISPEIIDIDMEIIFEVGTSSYYANIVPILPDDTYAKLVSRTDLVKENCYESFDFMLRETDDTLTCYVNITENNEVSVSLCLDKDNESISYQVPLTIEEQENFYEAISNTFESKEHKNFKEYLSENFLKLKAEISKELETRNEEDEIDIDYI